LDPLVAKFNIPECEFDVNAQDALGWTPLHCAAWVGDLETTTALIERGAQLNVQTTHGLTPFHFAATQNNSKELVVAFLDRGVDIDARTNDGWTALHAAVRFDTCEGIAGILLNRGADVKVRDKSGWTTLHYLACFGGAENILHELTRRGVDINQEDIRGRRAVYYATRHGNNFLRIFLGAQMAHDSKLQSEFSLDDEIGTYKLFCHLCPDNLMGHMLLGDAYGKQDMFSEASSSYDKFIETNPRNRLLPGVDDIYHSIFQCDDCEQPLRGVGYRCLACADFDLCAACYRKSDRLNHPVTSNHQFLQIPTDEAIARMTSSGTFVGVQGRDIGAQDDTKDDLRDFGVFRFRGLLYTSMYVCTK